MGEDVVFKGNKDGIVLVVNESANFADIFGQLKAKLESAADFFTTGTKVKAPVCVSRFSVEERLRLATLLAEYGLAWTEPSQEAVRPAANPDEGVKQEAEGFERQALIVPKTLRGGQKVVYRGSVIVIGDVNPGAHIVAGGDIIVMGACRGIAHAGAYGDMEATVTANRLLASQLRIAGIIARAPDRLDKPEYIETARIKDGIVVIEPAIR